MGNPSDSRGLNRKQNNANKNPTIKNAESMIVMEEFLIYVIPSIFGSP